MAISSCGMLYMEVCYILHWDVSIESGNVGRVYGRMCGVG